MVGAPETRRIRIGRGARGGGAAEQRRARADIGRLDTVSGKSTRRSLPSSVYMRCLPLVISALCRAADRARGRAVRCGGPAVRVTAAALCGLAGRPAEAADCGRCLGALCGRDRTGGARCCGSDARTPQDPRSVAVSTTVIAAHTNAGDGCLPTKCMLLLYYVVLLTYPESSASGRHQ